MIGFSKNAIAFEFVHCAFKAPPYVVDKIKMEGKTYGISFVVAT